jgi:hypothetical protein
MPLPTRRQYKGSSVSTTTTINLLTADTAVTIASNTGWPAAAGVPFYVVISPGTSNEEKCLATISGTSLTLTRAQDDTTAQTHASGSTIYPVFTADDADEANLIASKMTTKGDLLTTNGSDINRLGVGTNALALIADSTATNGVKWGQVATAGIEDSAVTSAKIANGTIVADDLASSAVTADKIATDAVTTVKIQNGAVTAAKLDAAAAIPPTIVDAKGDLIAATAADTVARLAVGANNTVLTADSSTATGLKWASATQAVTAVGGAEVLTNQTTTSASYTDLATAGPAVTITTGTSVIVLITADLGDPANTAGFIRASFAVSGATTRAASDNEALVASGAAISTSDPFGTYSRAVVITGLTAGSNVFTMKYKVSAGTASFQNRNIVIVAL